MTAIESAERVTMDRPLRQVLDAAREAERALEASDRGGQIAKAKPVEPLAVRRLPTSGA
jgi:hypothetical protein